MRYAVPVSEDIVTLGTGPKKFVFVLMPFDSVFDDVYELGIKPACAAAGAYCERVDEQIFASSILERVYNQIAKADLIIADMTSRNPNVFYEVGYVHALDKIVILLTSRVDDIPFDLKHYPHIVYGGHISGLRDALEIRVRWFAEHSNARVDPQLSGLTTLMQGQPLVPDATIHLPFQSSDRFRLAIDLFNESIHAFEPWTYSLALILPARVRPAEGAYVIQTADGRNLYELREAGTAILAGGWGSVYTYIQGRDLEYYCRTSFNAEFRAVGRYGDHLTTPFKIQPRESQD